MRLLLAFEQYYMLKNDPQNNTLYVAAGSPGGMATAEANRELNAQPLYMYQDGVLIYKFDAMQAGSNTPMAVLGLSKYYPTLVNSGTLLYDIFLLSKTMLEGAPESLLSVSALQLLVNNAKANYRP